MQFEIVNILGTEYTVKRLGYEEDLYFGKANVTGYCEPDTKTIIVGDLSTFKEYEDEEHAVRKAVEIETARHEILHAFLFESGLRESSIKADCGWAMNEEMIDWFAIQGPKIMKVWKQLRLIED